MTSPFTAASSLRKFGLLATLYAAQGLPFGFFAHALPTLMRQQDYSLRWIGLSSLLALPWALKWVWAPWIDRYSEGRFFPWRLGRRRAWLLPLQTLNVVTLLALAFTQELGGLSLLIIGCFLTNLVSATQDVATDGLAVAILSERERGVGNGIQVAGYRLGMIIGGGALLVAFETWGWTPTLASMAGLLALASLPVWFYREPASEPPSEVLGVRSWLQRTGARRWIFVLLAYKAGDALATAMMKPYLVDTGLGLADVGWLVGSLGSVTGLLGALLGGLGCSRWGTRSALLGFGLFSAASIGAYAVAAAHTPSLVQLGILIGVEHLAGGMATVALFTEMMRHCRPGSEGNDYTVQASLVVLATGAAQSVSGFIAEPLGYAVHFTACTLLAVSGAWLAYRLSPTLRAAASEATAS